MAKNKSKMDFIIVALEKKREAETSSASRKMAGSVWRAALESVDAVEDR
jgi:hypothetical protein